MGMPQKAPGPGGRPPGVVRCAVRCPQSGPRIQGRLLTCFTCVLCRDIALRGIGPEPSKPSTRRALKAVGRPAVMEIVPELEAYREPAAQVGRQGRSATGSEGRVGVKPGRTMLTCGFIVRAGTALVTVTTLLLPGAARADAPPSPPPLTDDRGRTVTLRGWNVEDKMHRGADALSAITAHRPPARASPHVARARPAVRPPPRRSRL